MYSLYTLGHALVDIEFHVENDFLVRAGLHKGSRIVITPTQEKQLLTMLHQLPSLKTSGGSGANATQTLTQFGEKSFFCGKLANDELGDLFYQQLVATGIDTNTNHKHRVDHDTTGHCIVLVTPDGDRTMCVYLGAANQLSVNDIQETALQNAKFLYVEGYLLAEPTTRQAALFACNLAHQHHVQIACSLSDPDILQPNRAHFLTMFNYGIDLLFCNTAEALCFCDCNDVLVAAEKLKQYVKRFIITLGDEGALLVDHQQVHQLPTHAIDPVDTLGAGDVFAGAMLYGLSHGFDFIKTGQFANAAAAEVVNKYGPRLSNDEAKHFLYTHRHLLTQ